MPKTAPRARPIPSTSDPIPFTLPLTPPDARFAVPTLSADAQLAYDYLSQDGRLSQVALTRLVGEARAGDVLAELTAAWLAVEVPGGLETRSGRAGYLAPVRWVPAAGLLEVEAAARLLSGRSGLLGMFARALDMDSAGALGVMRALVVLGLAQGGPVGATFAFRVHAQDQVHVQETQSCPPDGGQLRLEAKVIEAPVNGEGDRHSVITPTPHTLKAGGERMSRSIPAQFTIEQRQFMTAVTTSRRHLFLRATAGAGKTTTLTEAAWHLEERGVYFAYNRHAVSDLQPRLPDRVRALTLHAHGFRLLQQHLGSPLQILDEKGRLVASTVIPDRTQLHAPAARAWTIAREEGLHLLTPERAKWLADRAQWPAAPDELVDLIPVFHQVGADLWSDAGAADFTDLLWLPVTLGYGMGSLALALVDEAQDLTPLRQRYVLHLLGLNGVSASPGRLIFVGDSDQSIYTWAGADPMALSRLKERVDALELPLSVSFRCPREVVRYARAHSSFIRPAPRAETGTVEHVSAETATYERGDVVLCRTNAPLIRLALELMSRKLSVAVTGRDLAQRLRDGVTEAFPPSFENDAVTDLVRAYLEPVAAPLKVRVSTGDQGARRALTELLDVGRCLRYLAWVVSRRTGVGTQADALTLLGQLCREDAEADVLLASVHRAKGKEWPRVTVLYPELMPLSQGDEAEERAVQFVAVTRAQRVLRFAYGKEAWAAQQLVMPGVLPAAEAEVAPEVPAWAEGLDSALPEPSPVRAVSLPPSSSGGRSILPPLPVGGPTVATVTDPRVEWPLFGGDTPMPMGLVRERLAALAEEDRTLLRMWAEGGLTLLQGVEAPYVGIHEAHLALFERAARQARLAIPAMFGTGVPVCVFEGPLLRVRLARKVRLSGRVLRVALGDLELRFDRLSGELLNGAEPLAPFIRPAELGRLQAS
ncbi:UvrD-helicase domain-containing protein [Deinococcus sp. 6GRE01]|uniref:UvrD-helicase domain-containing protein n=1 Tax=Deinococcus sp. 6GRE01 TaxID=2745873 RepID=UPI0027145E9F|nr:UvrD-helicase domain-containing protein [Deinococcus sp. 6GRE01]